MHQAKVFVFSLLIVHRTQRLSVLRRCLLTENKYNMDEMVDQDNASHVLGLIHREF